MRTAVITPVSGRHAHLRAQHAALRREDMGAARHVVVAMGDGEASRCRAHCGETAAVVPLEHAGTALPLARARNAGAEYALASGAELLVFLDVDCLPVGGLLERYRSAAARTGPALLCGPVAYLPPPPRDGYPASGLHALARPHPARPSPPDGVLEPGGDHTLFWSLSFAVTSATWRRIGGFSEAYVGYGAEDTDFGQRARSAGADLCWVGGALAFHQHHPVASPPVQHLDDILRNARIFHARWGWWPMSGWLLAFAERGLAHYDAAADAWKRGASPEDESRRDFVSVARGPTLATEGHRRRG